MSYIKSFKPQKRSDGVRQGYYQLLNPHKYIGDNKVVIYRSSLEYEFCIKCDTDISILKWISEPDLGIRYVHPLRKKISNYYPDFMVKFKSEKHMNGFMWAVVELKADNAINLPKDGNISKMSNYIKQLLITNLAKKKAAERYCAEKNMPYIILTEKSSFFKNKRR